MSLCQHRSDKLCSNVDAENSEVVKQKEMRYRVAEASTQVETREFPETLDRSDGAC